MVLVVNFNLLAIINGINSSQSWRVLRLVHGALIGFDLTLTMTISKETQPHVVHNMHVVRNIHF